jgi:predicted nucleic acid-binding protein
VPLSDAIIAVVARKHGYAILTLDRHFDHLEVPLHPTKNQ